MLPDIGRRDWVVAHDLNYKLHAIERHIQTWVHMFKQTMPQDAVINENNFRACVWALNLSLELFSHWYSWMSKVEPTNCSMLVTKTARKNENGSRSACCHDDALSAIVAELIIEVNWTVCRHSIHIYVYVLLCYGKQIICIR